MFDRKSVLNKRRRRSIVAFEMIRLDRSPAEPLHEQLYRQIRDELRLGSFTEGAFRLPSSRALAADLGISRLTVSLAFSKLHEEGYLQSKLRSGTFVADPLPEIFLNAVKPTPCAAIERPLRISDRVRAIPDKRVRKEFALGISEATAGVSLISGHPAVDEFPIEVWERLRAKVLAKKGAALLRYSSNCGDDDLRIGDGFSAGDVASNASNQTNLGLAIGSQQRRGYKRCNVRRSYHQPTPTHS